MTKLLAASGYIGGTSTVEVVNLDDSKPNLICDNLPNLPFGLWGSVGHLFRGTPFICGGYSGQFESRCNTLESGAWKSMPSMNETRYYPLSAVLTQTDNAKDNIIFMAGGNPHLSTVEAFDGKIWNQTTFANLSYYAELGCMVKINNSMLLAFRGKSGGGDTIFFNVIQNKWIAGPKLAIPRYYYACGVINWKNQTSGNFEKVVVVAGGEGPNDKSVELLFLNDFEKYNSGWKVGPNLPLGGDGQAMAEFKNGVIIIGGRSAGDSRRIFQLTSPFGNWTEMKQTLKEPRSHFVSFLVPDELVNCH